MVALVNAPRAKSERGSSLATFGRLYSLAMRANGGQSAPASHFARHAMVAERDHPEVFEQAHAEGMRGGDVEQDFPPHLAVAAEVAYRHGHAAGRLRHAHAQGVAAGLVGESRARCPYDATEGATASLRLVWLEARKNAGVRS
jgi:ribosome modulation factor